MDEGDAVDLSKENIQPLKQGRNASILGLALQAQNDEQIHQRLQKMQEAYEIKIRTYNGPDLLGLWVEYISWVEQVFPKHGLEGNLEVLLQKCFSALKDEECYKQDHRFVKLWIKFIDMQTTDRLEVYRFLSGQGIGTVCAEFYRSWAYEFEQLEDYKHADAVFQLGYTNMAQPAAELEAAHTQFQLRVARVVLNSQINYAQEPTTNPDTENHRSAMASLCSIGPKQNKAPVIRVGANVLSATPGVLPNPSHAKSSVLGPSNIMKDRIPIYQDTADSVEILGNSRARAPATSIQSYRNKENSQGAGTWTKPGAARSKIPPQVAVYQPLQAGPSFEVHRDEAAAIAPATPLKTFTPNVLKPRKVEENPIKEALAVYEQPDPSIKLMYPKDKIYGGGKELQLEEIMAIVHWEEKARDSGYVVDPVEQERLRLQEKMREIEEKLNLLPKKTSTSQPVQPTSGKMEEALQLAVPSSSDSKIISRPIGVAEAVNNSTGSANQSESKESHSVGYESSNASSARVDNRSFNSLNGLLTPGDAATHSANNSNVGELSLDKKRGVGGSGNRGHSSIYNQSLTVHTKLAMNEVDDLWRSPNPSKFPESPAVLPERQALPDGSVLAFDICRDETNVIRPEQQNIPRFPMSGLKTTIPLVLSDRGVAKSSLSAKPEKNADPFRILPDDPEESLAHALGPDVSFHKNVFKEPSVVPFRNALGKGPPEKGVLGQKRGVVQYEPLSESNMPQRTSLVRQDSEDDLPAPSHISLAASSQEATIPAVIPSVQVKPQVSDFMNFGDEPEAEFSVFKEPEVQKNAENIEFQFNVFVDEQEAKMPTPSIPPATPGNKLNVIAKEKENAQKFSHVEIEEIAKKPKMAPPRRSILPQLNSQLSNVATTTDKLLRGDLPSPFPDDDETCTTKVFSGGFLTASTPFTVGTTRDKESEFDYGSQNLNGSIFVNAPSEEMGPPKSTVTLKDTTTDDNQLSTIYEVSSSSNRTGSSQSAGGGTGTISIGISYQEAQPHLNTIDRENEDSEADFTEPYHHDVTVCINGEVDPFDKVVIHNFLNKLKFPQAHHRDGLLKSEKNVPGRRNDTFVLDNENFKIIKQLGEGAYAKVWHVIEETTKRHVALKIQKPCWQWEYYICREIQFRLENKELASAFLHAEKMYMYNNGSVLLTDMIPHGSLLDLTNKLSQCPGSVRRESLVIIMADHLLRVVDALHSCDIIHGDLKPDNILIRSIPKMGSTDSCLLLIDFGRSIDMSLFPLGTTFLRNVKTDGFSCVEMQTNRPWTYQTDLYGLASSIHCLLIGSYMKVREINGRWHLQQSIPRCADKERWTNFFSTLLNVESCNMMPNLKFVREGLLKGFTVKSRDFDDLEKVIKS